MANIWNEENFREEVLEAAVPVMVDFYADWCGPCKMISPMVEKLAEEYAGQIKVGKINVDDNMAPAAEYRIMSIPAILFFKNGEVADQIIGAVPRQQLVAKIEALL